MRGCTAFDCLGAGQRVTQATFGGRSWRDGRRAAGAVFAAFPVMRVLHEILAYLDDALSRPEARPRRGALRVLRDEVDGLGALGPDALARVDLNAVRARVAPELAAVAAAVRRSVGGASASLRGAELAGAQRRGSDLCGADLRGASSSAPTCGTRTCAAPP
jgi:uncharacterized protein YjbI with pentapeptide repeats